LTIAAVLAVVAVPSLMTYQRNAELTSATNTLLAAVNAARGEAMKRGMNAMVLPADGVNWRSGWVVFVDQIRSQTYTDTADGTVLTQGPLKNYFSITGTGSAAGTAPYILYDASGYSKLKNGGFSALTLSINRTDVTGTAVYEQTRRIVLARTGRARSCKPSSASDSNCSASATQ
jgi:type IV fimbrial biogenesis protein FimT